MCLHATLNERCWDLGGARAVAGCSKRTSQIARCAAACQGDGNVHRSITSEMRRGARRVMKQGGGRHKVPSRLICPVGNRRPEAAATWSCLWPAWLGCRRLACRLATSRSGLTRSGQETLPHPCAGRAPGLRAWCPSVQLPRGATARGCGWLRAGLGTPARRLPGGPGAAGRKQHSRLPSVHRRGAPLAPPHTPRWHTNLTAST